MKEAFFDNTLVRYRAFTDNNIDALENDCLYFSVPEKTFNDPYDILVYANYLEILSEVNNSLQMRMDDYLENLKKKDKFRAGIGYAAWNGTKRDEFLEGLFADIRRKVEGVQAKLRENVKVICFSEELESMLMWSHYADNHKGFAILYDVQNILQAEPFTLEGIPIKKKPVLRKVDYVERQFDLTREISEYVRVCKMPTLGDVKAPNVTLSQEKLHKAMLQKSVEWKYEKEWRLLPKHINLEHASNLGYIRIMPKAIVLGAKCEEENEKRIQGICEKKRIPLFKIILNFLKPEYRIKVIPFEKEKLESWLQLIMHI